MTRFYLSAPNCAIIFIGLIMLGFPLHLQAGCQITLEWESNGLRPDGYRLYERDSSQEEYSNQYYDLGEETSCTVSGLEENNSYHFIVRSYIGDEESNNSNEAIYECTPESATDDESPTDENGPTEADAGAQETSNPEEPKEEIDISEPINIADPNPPGVPKGITPEDTARDISLGPILKASDYDDPDPGDDHLRSRWQIFRFDDNDCIYDVISSSDLTTIEVPPNTLEPFTTYYWTVTYYSKNGGQSKPSSRHEFTTSNKPKDDGNQEPTEYKPKSSSLFGGGGGESGVSDGLFGVGCFIKTLLK